MPEDDVNWAAPARILALKGFRPVRVYQIRWREACAFYRGSGCRRLTCMPEDDVNWAAPARILEYNSA